MVVYGSHKTGIFCFYIKKLEDVDETILQRLIEISVEVMRAN